MSHNYINKNKVGLLIVTYNQFEITSNFIKMFLNTFQEPDIHLLVLDNNSNDNTTKKLKDEYPNIDIRKLNDNYGCVTGRNIGIIELYKLGCKYIYISDNDIEIKDPEYFNKMKSFLDKTPHIDGCCPIVRWGDDNSIQTMGARLEGGYKIKNIHDINSDVNVNILPGCAQFIKIESFKKYGLYDNDLSPISIEDYDWGVRSAVKGAQFQFNPEVEIVHLHDRNIMDSSFKKRHVIVGRTIFLRKYFSLYRLLQELVFMVVTAMNYGVSFTLRSYFMGLRKRRSPLNYEFNVFCQNNLDQYYD
jgi:GT2 family glycosyltransferase